MHRYPHFRNTDTPISIVTSRGHISILSSTTETKKCNGRGKTTSSFPAGVTTHRPKKVEWKWPAIEHDILIMGTEGLSAITSSPKEDIK